ncbi:MAG: dTMP kinase [Planctomycetes bacterium]|nr:dTMP kinase [Planctomycetota bacterium]
MVPTDATPPRARGLFVVLDGIDGCGKSTQARRLATELERRTGRRTHHLREPGSTSLGESLRALLLSREHRPTARVETLLFAAARAQMLDELVEPALARGEHVVCERFHPSTFAYQAVAGGLDEDLVLGLLHGFAGAPRPDLVLLLDLSVDAASARRGAATDRIEDKGAAFQERVAAGYRRYAEKVGGSIVLRADRGEDEVARDVWSEVERALR